MNLRQKIENFNFSMRHVTLGFICMCLGIYRGGLISAVVGLGLGLAIAEITHMIDSMGKK